MFELRDALQHLLSLVIEFKYCFLWHSTAHRINPEQPAGRESITASEFARDRHDRPGLDRFISKALKRFGAGPGLKPKLEADDCRKSSLPFWAVSDTADLNFLSDKLVKSCANLSAVNSSDKIRWIIGNVHRLTKPSIYGWILDDEITWGFYEAICLNINAIEKTLGNYASLEWINNPPPYTDAYPVSEHSINTVHIIESAQIVEPESKCEQAETAFTCEPMLTGVQFMGEYCVLMKPDECQRKWTSILNKARDLLPQPAVTWKIGKPLQFYAKDLRSVWNKLKERIPGLPALKEND